MRRLKVDTKKQLDDKECKRMEGGRRSEDTHLCVYKI